MDLNKYDLPKEEKQPLSDWKESVPIILLSDALKIVGRKHGIRLRTDDDGVPCLSFRPGFNIRDVGSERWNIAEQVAELFLDAADDMGNLIASGKLTLPGQRSLI